MSRAGTSHTKPSRSAHKYGKYVKGASILFAERIATGQRVIVLCPPPPDRMHPSGATNFQTLEEPIIKRGTDPARTLQIQMCHPMVSGAEDYCYEFWPEDHTDDWIRMYGNFSYKRRVWRPVRRQLAQPLSDRIAWLPETSHHFQDELCTAASTGLISPKSVCHGEAREPSSSGGNPIRDRLRGLLSILISHRGFKIVMRLLIRVAAYTAIPFRRFRSMVTMRRSTVSVAAKLQQNVLGDLQV